LKKCFSDFLDIDPDTLICRWHASALRRPGLGFAIDRGLLKKYGKCFFRLAETRLNFKVVREKGIRSALD
jgi:hypothetical protein